MQFKREELDPLYLKLTGQNEFIDNIQFERDFSKEERQLLTDLYVDYLERQLKGL